MKRLLEHALNLELSTRTRTRVFRVWLVIFTAIMLWAGLTAVHATAVTERNSERDAARACVLAWQGREDIRDMVEKGYRRNASTLISLFPNARPELVAAYEAQVERDIAEIRAELPDPDCDLPAARRVFVRAPSPR